MPDYQYLLATGVIVPETSQILGDVQSEYKQVFGQDLVTSSDTPQGVLMAGETLARTEVVNNNAALGNQINPNVATGVFLDAIAALTGIQRTPATRTLVPGVTLTGIAGTVISAGTKAQTVAGDVFISLSNVVIGGGGSVTVDFASEEFGPVPCGIGDLTQIVSSILGWETVNNTVAGTPGTATQSDEALRAFRNNSLAFQGVSLPLAITSALYNVPGVTSLAFLENVAATTEVIQGVSLVAHSIWVCVRGGSDLDIAAALLENKSSGAAWNGSVEIDVIEPASGQEYTVKFERPEEVPILIRVTTPNGNADDIKQAILDYVNGTIDGQPGFVVGADVSPFELSGAINREFPSTFVSKVEISLDDPISYTTDVIDIDIDQIAVTQASYITVVIS